ncbi:MAG: SGNH/GDSL hydrolase family protein [Phycisphaerae bacterium]|nr:SGNH/GDSL hydrolase family protein [Gemmatimonadaceae bacterium]
MVFQQICKVLLASACSLACFATPPTLEPLPPGGIHVLFIGNSLTYSNDLPGTLSALALATGDTIRTASITDPDYALVDHLQEGFATRAIKADTWHYVVLQQGPSSLQVNRDSLIDITKLFDATVKQAGAKTALFSVWPQTVNYATFPRAIESYRLAAEAVAGVYLPVGAAWLAALTQDQTIPLYSGDGLHPSELGTYLAALVMYERFTGKDARLLPSSAVVNRRSLTGVSVATVRKLQDIAHAENRNALANVR